MDDLVGLVFIDWLILTPVQWASIGLNTGLWLWWLRLRPPTHRLRGRDWWGVASLALAALWIAFWKTPTCVDTYLLFKAVCALSPVGWEEFLNQMLRHGYVDHQPPFLTFWLAWLPILWAQQLLWLPWALLCTGLLFRLYGRNAALLLATPVVALMIHQPSHDLLLFGALLIVLRLIQMKQRTLAAVVYGLTWPIKPLTVLTAPFIVPQLGAAGLVSVGLWGGYVLWSFHWEFGRQQWRFLLQQVFITAVKPSSTPAQIGSSAVSPVRLLRRTLAKISGTWRWRWKHLGRKAVRALPLYLFPTYACPWRWQGAALTAIIVLGYGNIKYLLLALLFVFPVQPES